MMAHVARALCLLALPALLPTVAVVGVRPIALFLVPLAGSVLAAVAAEFELAVGGSILPWFVALAALANVVGVWRLWRVASRDAVDVEPGEHPSVRAPLRRFGKVPRLLAWSPWSWITILAVIGAVGWPLRALRNPLIFDDGYAIWTLHSIFIYGGHHAFLSGLRNPAYGFSNPDYPPLVPASGAIAFVSDGRVDIRLAVILTSVLNACGLGVVAFGVIEAAGRKGRSFGSRGRHRSSRRRLSGRVRSRRWLRRRRIRRPTVGGDGDCCHSLRPSSPLFVDASRRRVAVRDCRKSHQERRPHDCPDDLCPCFIPLHDRTASISITHNRFRGINRRRGSPQGTRTSFRLGKANDVRVDSCRHCHSHGRPWLGLGRTGQAQWDRHRYAFLGRSPQTVEQRVHPTLAGLADNLHILPVAGAVTLVGLLVLRSDRS